MAEECTYRLADVLAALSCMLDRVEGQPEGHIVRSCVIGMRLAASLPFSAEQRAALYYALLLKDAGCSSNAAHIAALFDTDDLIAKRAVKTVDTRNRLATLAYLQRVVRPHANGWAKAKQLLVVVAGGEGAAREFVQMRCERGAAIARTLSLPGATATAIYHLDERWDGSGYPDGLQGAEISLLARICSLAQTVEVFARTAGVAATEAMVRARSGKWFDPVLADRFLDASSAGTLWQGLTDGDLTTLVTQLEPNVQVLRVTDARLDQVAIAISQIIDAKSPYTARHSARVAAIAAALGEEMGLPDADVHTLWRAGLLHDLGKLAISNRILDKPGRLTAEETAIMRIHPALTYETLDRIVPFRALAGMAAAHHERLDGSGYPRGVTGADLGQMARILAVADVYEAMTSDRPYRPAMSAQAALVVMQRERGVQLDAESIDCLETLVETDTLDRLCPTG